MRTKCEDALSWVLRQLSNMAGFLRLRRLEWVLIFWSADMSQYYGGDSPRHFRAWRVAWSDATDLEAQP